MNTFKDIIEALESFATAHKQVNDFGFGNIDKINTNKMQFPALFITPQPSETTHSITQLVLDMYVLDLLEQSESNLLQTISDTMLIGNDTIANFFVDKEEILGFEIDSENVRITPFIGKFDHLTSGWIYTITLTMLNNNNCSTSIPV